MSVLARLLRPRSDGRAALRPLWHRIVAVSRNECWYRDGGVADSVAGRFDMIVTLLALVLLRLEKAGAPARPGVYLTELFVADMDRQLRESGVGDLMVGKHIGRLVAVLGGRLGAYRSALADGAAPDALTAAVARNVSLAEGREPGVLAGLLMKHMRALDDVAVEDLLDGTLPG
ncbi:MAG: hypothetical protein H5U21_02615 [Porphyrobacter sp.]|nr:hypothetical protein [Porphyrobacter sp.]